MNELDIYGLYGESWQNEIIPDAFAHPAKFSRALIRWIYQHCIEQGYIKPGDRIVDPFGGVALGGLDAMRNGLHWHGVELEEKFVALGNQNIAMWNERYSQWFREWGTAQLIRGDSRQLASVLSGQVGAAISSPPYIDSVNATDNGIDWEKAGRPDRLKPSSNRHGVQGDMATNYGRTPGQLGSMPEGNLDAAISSPPYADAVSGSGEGPGARHDPIYHNGDNAHKNSSQAEYGSTPGNLGNMAACVSSPPFESSIENGRARNPMVFKGNPSVGHYKEGQVIQGGGLYGDTSGNIGNDSGKTFWQAARTIVEQVHAVLKPGGYCVWVTKDFVRNKKRVEYSDQWQALCEACGFVPIERIQAWVIEERGTQGNLFTGEFETKTIERKSFFRRLAERKGSPRIDWEDVLVLRKPL